MKVVPGVYQYTAAGDSTRFRVLDIYKRANGANPADSLRRVNGWAICRPPRRSAMTSLTTTIELASVASTPASKSTSQCLPCGNRDVKVTELLPLLRQTALPARIQEHLPGKPDMDANLDEGMSV